MKLAIHCKNNKYFNLKYYNCEIKKTKIKIHKRDLFLITIHFYFFFQINYKMVSLIKIKEEKINKSL